MESLTVNIFVKDINETIAFYKKMGFTLTATVPEQGNFVWVMMNNDDVTIMFQTFDSLGDELKQISRQDGGSLIFYIKIKNIRAFFEKIQQQQINILKGLEKTFYGATEFSILDNNNYVLTFAEDE